MSYQQLHEQLNCTAHMLMGPDDITHATDGVVIETATVPFFCWRVVNTLPGLEVKVESAKLSLFDSGRAASNNSHISGNSM